MPTAFRFLLPLLAAPLLAQGADVTVRVDRSGNELHVDASAEFDGTIVGTWRVLTDYGRLAEFIPDVHSSRVVARKGNVAHVEQKGEARLLFLSFPVDVRFEITEHPYERIVSRAVAGNFREMRGVYQLEAGLGRVSLRYTGRLVPDFYVPPQLGTLVLRHHVESTFRALVEEIERQHKPVSRDP